jgi:hypothetical protein
MAGREYDGSDFILPLLPENSLMELLLFIWSAKGCFSIRT